MRLPEASIGRLLVHGLDLRGREVTVDDHRVQGRLRIARVGIETFYPGSDTASLDEPHAHPLALVVDADVVDGDFGEAAQLGGAGDEIRVRDGAITSRLRIEPGRILSNGRWQLSSMLLAPHDASAAARVTEAVEQAGPASLAPRLMRAALPPLQDDSLAAWLLRTAPAALTALPWAERTRVERDDHRYHLTVESIHAEPAGAFGFHLKWLVRYWTHRGDELRDVREQEIYLGGFDWSCHAIPPFSPDAAVAAWFDAQCSQLRRFLAAHDTPDRLMPHDLPWIGSLAGVLLERSEQRTPPPPRPRSILPTAPAPSLALVESPPVVARFSAQPFHIAVELPNAWSYRLVLHDEASRAILLDVDSDGLHGGVRVIDGDSGRVREVARWLHAAIEGDPHVDLPNANEEEEDDDFPPERKPLRDLLGFTTEDELVDWRCVPDDIAFADITGESTDVDAEGRALWRAFLESHFESA